MMDCWTPQTFLPWWSKPSEMRKDSSFSYWASRTAELPAAELGATLRLMQSTLSAANQIRGRKNGAPSNQNKTKTQESNTAVGFLFFLVF